LFDIDTRCLPDAMQRRVEINRVVVDLLHDVLIVSRRSRIPFGAIGLL